MWRSSYRFEQNGCSSEQEEKTHEDESWDLGFRQHRLCRGGVGPFGLRGGLDRCAFEVFGILAFDADQPGRPVAHRRMNITDIIDMGIAGPEAIASG